MTEDYSIELALIHAAARRPTEETRHAMYWRNGKRWVALSWAGAYWTLSTRNRSIWTGSARPKRRHLSFAELHEKITNPRFAKYWRIAP